MNGLTDALLKDRLNLTAPQDPAYGSVEEVTGRICPLMTRELRFPVYCQKHECQMWQGYYKDCGLKK
jgi:hypothetical protein